MFGGCLICWFGFGFGFRCGVVGLVIGGLVWLGG